MESSSNESHHSELSELELDELIETKFVESQEKYPNPEDIDDDGEKIETARNVAVGSPMAISPIGNEESLLDDYSRMKVDHAVQLLIRIQNSTDQELKHPKAWNLFKESKQNKNTNRVSELALIDYIITNFDHRPPVLHLFCRRLIETDIQDFIRKALLVGDAPEKNRTVFRMTVKTDMPLKQLIGQLEKIWKSSTSIQLQDFSVTADQKNLDGTKKKYRTQKMATYAEMEHKILLQNVQPMQAAAHFPFTVTGRPFVNVNVDYRSDLDEQGRRHKTIVIEQIVTPKILPGKRVTFGTPLVETVHEFELDEMEPFHHLKFKVFDLIGYLECVGPNSVGNITVRA